MASRALQHGLTPDQARLLERHGRGVARVAMTFAGRLGCEPNEVIVLLAHRLGRVGTALGDHLDAPGASGVIVIPGLLPDLSRWIERLALAGPVNDCTGNTMGTAVIVVDERGEMALCKVAYLTTAAASDAQKP